jgi:hypothetical protein
VCDPRRVRRRRDGRHHPGRRRGNDHDGCPDYDDEHAHHDDIADIADDHDGAVRELVRTAAGADHDHHDVDYHDVDHVNHNQHDDQHDDDGARRDDDHAPERHDDIGGTHHNDSPRVDDHDNGPYHPAAGDTGVRPHHLGG